MTINQRIIFTAVVLFITGATMGNLYNSFHAYSGTIPVTSVHIHPLHDWTSYLLFGIAGVLIGATNLLLDKFSTTPPKPFNRQHVAGAIAFLGVFYSASAFMFISNTVILLLLVVGFVLALYLFDRRPIAVLIALIVAIGGSGLEIFFVHRQLYYYARPQVAGVTYWLPFLYAIASVTTGVMARVIFYTQGKPFVKTA